MLQTKFLRNIFLLIGFTLSLNFAVAQNQSHACYYQIELTDDYDDGWNGAEVEIIDSVGNVIYTLGKSFTDGAIFMHNVLLNSGLTYSLVVSDEGNYPEEIGLVIKSNGVIVSTYNPSFSTSLNTQMASLSPTCVNCLSSQMCSFNVTLTDSYGDGWDGARAEIRDTNGNIFYVLGVNFSTGSTYTDSVVLCSSNQYKIVLTDEGDYPQEIGLSVSDGLSFVSSYSPSSNTSTGAELASFTAACISGNVDAITSCGPYTWTNGLTYSTSNFSAVDTLTNVNGQDSIVTLNLVVNSPQYRADSVVSFSSYTWIDGNTYSQSTSVPSMTFTDSNGCDSIVNLVLSIRSPGVVSREIMFMPDEPKDILTSKPQYPDSTWANTRIFNIDRLIDAYTHYPDDDSTIVGTGLYRVINATPREYYNVVVWGIFQNTTDTVFIRDFSLLRSFESIILELPYVAGTGQKTFTTINGGSVTISNPFNKDIDFYLECSDESFNKLREIEMSTRLWFLDNQKTTGNFDDPTPAFCRHFLTAYANIAYMWSQAEFEDSWQDVDMIIHGNQSWHGFIKKSNGTYLKTSLITTNSDSLTLTGDSTSGLPNTSWLMYEEISMDTIFKSNGDTLINDKWFLGTNTTVLDSFPNSELYKLLPVSDTLNKLSILNTFKAKSDQYLGNIKNVSGLGGGSLLGIAGGQMIGQRFYESIGQSNSTFYHEFAHGINYHHSSNLTYADARGGWELFNRKMFEGYSGSRDTVDLTFKNGQPRVITKTLPFIEPFYRQDVFHTDSVNISSEFGVDTILDIKIINLHEWLYTSTAISSRYSRNDTKKPDLVIDSLSLPYGVTTSQVFPLIIPIGDTADVSIRLKFTNLSTTDTSVTKDSIVIHGEHTHWIPLEVELIPLNYSSIDTVKECDNYYWGVNNETYESSNIVIEELTDSQGQDSILILSLEINQSYSDTIHQLSYCTPFYWQGDTIFASGLYSSSFISEHGCDSTLYLDFTRIDGIDSSFVSANNDDAKEFQNNGSMNLGSKALQLGGTSGKLLKSGFRFSDVGLEKGTNIQSARVSMVARSNDSSPLKITIAGVALDSTSSFSNTSYHLSSLPQTNEKVEWTVDNWTKDSTYYTADVSSIITEITNRPNWKAGNALTLIMWPTDSSTSNQRTLRSKNDGSIIGLYVNYGNPIEIVDTVATSYFWPVSQSSYSTSGVYVFVPTGGACSDYQYLDLTLNAPTSATSYDSIFACGSYTWINGVTYTSSTSAPVDTLTSSTGQDSVVTLNLTINSPTTGTDIQTACNSYTWIDGVTYTSSNSSATYTLTNAVGCDSVVTLNLTINSPTTGTDIQTACNSYTWIDGVTYTSSNSSATYSLTNAAGCDSVVTLNLTIESIDDSVVLSALTIYALPGYDSYQWYECTSNGYMMMSNETNDSISITANGDYAVVINNNNCSDTSDCVTVNNIGLREETQATFRIYPNPTQGKVKVERDNFSSPTGTYQLQIVDSRGKVTQRSNVDFQNGFITINLENYPAGVYQITLINQHEVYHDKISLVK
ncbi:T9SS type A sorting domain-containing protein [Schleiferiaceae bacterium]|nr:T9SS type A sorting domain-containing protein [Schleiferiaceae bacterium]